MNGVGSTEGAYLQWLDVVGPLSTAYQEFKAKELLRLTRALDDIEFEDRAHSTATDRRARLLRKIRQVSKDLRASIEDGRVTDVTEIA